MGTNKPGLYPGAFLRNASFLPISNLSKVGLTLSVPPLHLVDEGSERFGLFFQIWLRGVEAGLKERVIPG